MAAVIILMRVFNIRSDTHLSGLELFFVTTAGIIRGGCEKF